MAQRGFLNQKVVTRATVFEKAAPFMNTGTNGAWRAKAWLSEACN